MSRNKHGAWRQRSTSISSIISTTLVLYALGVLLLVLIYAQRLTDYVKENFAIDLVLNEQIREPDALYLQQQLQQMPYVKEANYLSKEKAAMQFQELLGEDFIALLGYNPLMPAIELYIRAPWANSDSINLIDKQCETLPNVVRLEYPQDHIDQINENLRKVGLLLLAFAAIMTFIALVLIHNTIRIAVYAKRFIIKTMQWVGATPSFARRPFLKTAIAHGTTAAFIAAALIAQTLYMLKKEFPQVLVGHSYEILAAVSSALLVTGILIHLIATYLTVNKYLRASVERLYR